MGSAVRSGSVITTTSYKPISGWATPLPHELDSKRTLVLAFGSPRFGGETAPLAELRRGFPQSTLIGCSTAGEILNGELRDDSVAVAVCRFAETDLRTAYAPVHSPSDSEPAGRAIARQLLAPDLRAVFVLSAGLGVNGSELVRGLSATLPPGVVVTGGLAGDGPRFEKTWVLQGASPVDQMVTAVGFYGQAVRVGHGSRGGWDAFGPVRLVTRAEGNVLYELDGRPALALYRQYLGDRAAELPASALLFPLALRAPDDPDKSLVRTVLAIDDQAQSMTFAGDIPVGWTAQLMRANFDRLVNAAGESSASALAGAADESRPPLLSIAISCVGRRLILGERTEEELDAAREVLTAQDHQIGFYSYGELCPFAAGVCDLHNQTMTITTIREM